VPESQDKDGYGPWKTGLHKPRPINYSPVWGNRLSISSHAIAVELFTFLIVEEFSHPALENTGEQNENPSNNSNVC